MGMQTTPDDPHADVGVRASFGQYDRPERLAATRGAYAKSAAGNKPVGE